MKNRVYILLLLLSICLQGMSQLIALPDTSVCLTGSRVQLRTQNTGGVFVQGIPNQDDIHSGVVNIGFPFSFYGNTYNQCVLSTNNYISFNTALANTFSPFVISNILPTSTPAQIQNAILGPWHDLDPSRGGVMGYTTIGTAPNRQFIYAICNVPMFQCNAITYSGYITFFETSNIIEIHMQSKNTCAGWNNGRAILGTNNINGTVAHFLPAFNSLTSWNASNAALRFTPAPGGNYTLTAIPFVSLPVNFISYQWLSTDGVVIANNINPVVTVNSCTKYILRINTCSGTSYDTATIGVNCLDSVKFAVNKPAFCWDEAINTVFNTNRNIVTSYRYVIHEVPPGGTWFSVYTGSYINGTPSTNVNIRSLWNGFQPGKEYCISIDLFNNCYPGNINRTIVSCFKIKPKYERKQTIYFSCTDSCKIVTLLRSAAMPLSSAIPGWTNTPSGFTKTYCPTIAYSREIIRSTDSGGCNAYDTIIIIKDTCCINKATLRTNASYCWDAPITATYSSNGQRPTSYRILVHEQPAGAPWFAVYTGPYTPGAPPTSINVRALYPNLQAGKRYCITIDLFKNCADGSTVNRTLVACFDIKPKYERKQTIYFSCTDSCKEVLLASTVAMPMTAPIAGWTNSPLGKVKTYCPTLAYTREIIRSTDSGGCNAYDTIIIIKDTCCINKATLRTNASYCWDAPITATYSSNGQRPTSYRILVHEQPAGAPWFAVYTGPYTPGAPPTSINVRALYPNLQAGKRYCVTIDLFKNCADGSTVNRTLVACFDIKPKYERKQTIYFSCTDSCKEVLLASTVAMPMTAPIAGWTNSPLGKVKTYCPTLAYTREIVQSTDSGGCRAFDTIIIIKDTCCLNKACFSIPSIVCEDEASILLNFACNQARFNSYTIEIREAGSLLFTRTYNSASAVNVNLRTLWNGYQCNKNYEVRVRFDKNCVPSPISNTISKSFLYKCIERHATCIDLPCNSILDLNNLPSGYNLCGGPMISYTILSVPVSATYTNPLVLVQGTKVLKIKYACCELILVVKSLDNIVYDSITVTASGSTFTMTPCGTGLHKYFINGIEVASGVSSYTATYTPGNTYRVESTDEFGCKCIKYYTIQIAEPIVCTCADVSSSFTYSIDPMNPNTYIFTSTSTVCPAGANFPICHQGFEISEFPVPSSGATLPGGIINSPTASYTFPGPGTYQICNYTWYCAGGIMSEGCIKSNCQIITVPLLRQSNPASATSSNSIPEIENHASIVYPNPFSDKLSIDFDLPNEMKLDLVIYNSNGEQVYNEKIIETRKGNNTKTIDLKSLPNGLFVLKLVGNNYTRTHKISHIR